MINHQPKIKKEISEKIYRAYNTLLSRDIHLLKVGANERSITHKLAEYLQVEFSDWNVDCEYNRKLDNVKTVPVWKEKRKELLTKLEKEITEKQYDLINKVIDGGVSVYPDIIIHHRGTNDNLVVIEAKKSNFSGDDNDDEKLEAYKKDLGYKFAYKIIFPLPVDENIEMNDLSNYIQEK